MTNTQKYAIEVAKELTIAKLSQSAPAHSNAESGKNIGEMFEAIYNKVYSICSEDKSR